MFNEPKNSPFVSNIQRGEIRNKMIEKNRAQERMNNKANSGNKPVYAANMQKPIVDLQVYPMEQQKPKRRFNSVDPAPFRPVQLQPPYYYPPQWENNYLVPNQVPIVKNYNIEVHGPMTDHAKVSAIYEDILPKKYFQNTSNTLGERLNLYQFARSIFLKQGDGEDIKLHGGGSDSLLRQLKFIELNPYNTNQLSDNPYKGLPDNMLIYRSCYPIRYNKIGNNTTCAKNSVGMNIRIYGLTVGEYSVNNNKKGSHYDYDIWREIMYYEYVREEIIKKKISPNFITMYAYFINRNCNIDFKKLAQLKNKPSNNDFAYNIKAQKGGYIHPNDFNKLGYMVNKPPPIAYYDLNKNANKLKINNTDINSYSGHALVALTEAPTYNLFSWASKTYTVNGNVRTMINPGYHDPDIWKSVLFQIISALYVMQIKNIAFTNFSVADFVYIKDTNVKDNITNFWKYIINGIEYFVPNFGYLVLIDSNFKDIDKSGYTLSAYQQINPKKSPFNYKVNIGIFGNVNNSDIQKMTFDNFKETINPSIYSKSFTDAGGIKPPEEILQLLNQMYNEASSDNTYDIGRYIAKYMDFFFHNRIGTHLRKDEVKNILNDRAFDIHNGMLLVHEYMANTYKFVLAIGSDPTSNTVEIFTRDNNKKPQMIPSIPRTSLYMYSPSMPISQDYVSAKYKLNEENLLETYVIDNN